MIMDSKAPHKVPAISTSEDSQEAQKPASSSSSSEHCSKKNEIRSHGTAANDESRDMGETRRVMHKPAMDRDDMDQRFDNKEGVACSVAMASTSYVDAKSKENRDNGAMVRNETYKDMQATNRAGMLEDSSQSKLGTTKQAPHHSLLPSLSASFDHGMDGQPWSHAFNDGGVAGSKEKKPPKPKHRRSPATTVCDVPCITL